MRNIRDSDFLFILSFIIFLGKFFLKHICPLDKMRNPSFSGHPTPILNKPSVNERAKFREESNAEKASVKTYKRIFCIVREFGGLTELFARYSVLNCAKVTNIFFLSLFWESAATYGAFLLEDTHYTLPQTAARIAFTDGAAASRTPYRRS